MHMQGTVAPMSRQPIMLVPKRKTWKVERGKFGQVNGYIRKYLCLFQVNKGAGKEHSSEVWGP